MRTKDCCIHSIAGLLMWDALSDERMGLQFTTATGPHQCSNSRVRFPRDSQPYCTVSYSRHSHPGGPGPSCIHIPQEQGGPVMPPGTGWVVYLCMSLCRTIENTTSNSYSLAACVSAAAETSCHPAHLLFTSRCIEADGFSC
jgi:hypothetical protein